MSKEIIATCPQCGAQGKAGKFCEYCGTKIPMPVKSQKAPKKENSKSPFSWYNVCPQGYEPDTKSVVGNYKESLFMVVINTNDDKYNKRSGIINREGKFVVDPAINYLTIFADNYDYINRDQLSNLLTGELIFDVSYLYKIGSGEYLYSNLYSKDGQSYRIFDR